MRQTALIYDSKSRGPVECLGLMFENDEKRREYFLQKLQEKLKDPLFRKIEGFPIGKDEDILALSDPPYYTACPNPFINDFITKNGKPYDSSVFYQREPFAADVTEGKNDPIYNAHSYHTKVPHKAIMRYILHYTEPGDIVFDGFCGTGMTGVAAQLCGDRKAVESIGYQVGIDNAILQPEEDDNGKTTLKAFSRLGARNVILNDLSPAATFISYNHNTPISVSLFEKEAKRIMEDLEKECGWMYETLHSDKKTKGKINYTVWSDVFVCPECSKENIFWEVAVDKNAGKVFDEFPCSGCKAKLTKRSMDRAWITKFDWSLNESIKQAKHVPVLINYKVGSKNYEKVPDASDLALIVKIEESTSQYKFPTDRMMEGGETRRNDPIGITHVHHFYTHRNLSVLASAFQCFPAFAKWAITGSIQRGSKQHQIAITRIGGEKAGVGGATAGHRRGTLYVPSNQIEMNAIRLISDRLAAIKKSLLPISGKAALITSQSATRLPLPDNSVDYFFFDPPFGANITYSELNSMTEAWLGVYTNREKEAIEDKHQKKSINSYRELMTACFTEGFRILKPGRWMTVEFSNTQASIWNAIQTALQEAGFVVANVSALDKGRGGLNAIVGVTAVKQDLIISAYKPNGGLEERFQKSTDSTECVWDFVRTHLKYLPNFKSRKAIAEFISERDPRIVYDRMVSYFVQHGLPVPLSSQEFQAGLMQRFAERDGMVFLSEQVAEYDRKRILTRQLEQQSLFVADERTAIDWLQDYLKVKPNTYQDILPDFMPKLNEAAWKKHESRPELSLLLEQNFFKYDGKAEVPSQIHSYLSTNFKDLRNLPKDSPLLKAKAKDRWYVPDPNKAQDLERFREKSLLKEFEEYRSFSGRKLKTFRLEAIRAGFKKAWGDKDYPTIITVAQKVPEDVLQEDPKLTMWYDGAMTRMGD